MSLARPNPQNAAFIERSSPKHEGFFNSNFVQTLLAFERVAFRPAATWAVHELINATPATRRPLDLRAHRRGRYFNLTRIAITYDHSHSTLRRNVIANTEFVFPLWLVRVSWQPPARSPPGKINYRSSLKRDTQASHQFGNFAKRLRSGPTGRIRLAAIPAFPGSNGRN